MPKHRRIMIILGAGLVIVALVFVFGGTAPSGRITPLAIRLASITNVSSQARIVQCIVSNSNDRAIWVWPTMPQVKSNGEWPQEVIMLPVPYAALQAKQTAQFPVTIPTNANGGGWRVPLLWVLQPPMKERIAEVIRQNVSAVQSGGALPGVRIGWGHTEAWTNYSPEVNP